MKHKGFSIVEILVTCVVVALAVGPMFTVFFSSSKASKASIYEIMAVHYASELGEQLQRLAFKLSLFRSATGKTIAELLQDASILDALKNVNPGNNRPQTVTIPGTNTILFFSPLHPNFLTRTLSVEEMDSSASIVLKNGTFWRVTIGLAWRMNPGDPVIHTASYSLILREDLP